jgi:hypothetical protein
MNRFLLAAALCACLAMQSCAQLPTLPTTAVLTFEPPSRENVRISLVSAVDRSFAVAINGREVGAIGPVSPFSAIFKPGTIDIVVSGPRFEAKARIVSAANEEYVFEVSSPPGAEPTLTLKRRGLQFGEPRMMLAYVTSR